MTHLQPPGVFIEDLPSGPPDIVGVSTAVTAFIGSAATGPADRAVLVTSWAEFVATFGGLLSGALLGYSVSHFFANGGRQAWIVRLTAGPGDNSLLQPGDGAFEKALALDAPAAGAGLHLLDSIDFNLLCVPGESEAAVIQYLQSWCTARRAFLIVDAPRSATVEDLAGSGPVAADLRTSLASAQAANSAYYFPWVLALDPLHAGQSALFPPCGFVAGIYAATDAQHGVWKSPAGIGAVLTGAAGLPIALTDADLSTIAPHAVNCLRTLRGAGTLVWGARTLAGDDTLVSDWKYVSVRRLSLFIESSIVAGTQWAVFEPNDERLWSRLRMSINSFLQQLFQDGAFQGATSQQAWFVECDASTTTQADIADGFVNIVIGFAPLRPAEFVVISIRQMTAQTPC